MGSLLSQFLARNPRRAVHIPVHSCRNTLVWQWLDAATAGADETGDAIRLMRRRQDMPRTFPNKKYLRAYMEKARVDDAAIDRTLERLWSLWHYWLEDARHAV